MPPPLELTVSLTVREKRDNRKRAKATQSGQESAQPEPVPARKHPRRNVPEKTYYADKAPAIVVRRNPVKDPPVPRLPGQEDILSSDDDIFATRRALQRANSGMTNLSADGQREQVQGDSCSSHPFGPPSEGEGGLPAALVNASAEDAQIIPHNNKTLPSFDFDEVDWQDFTPDISTPPATGPTISNHSAATAGQSPLLQVNTTHSGTPRTASLLTCPPSATLPNIVIQGATPLPIDRRLPSAAPIPTGGLPPKPGLRLPPLTAPNFAGPPSLRASGEHTQVAAQPSQVTAQPSHNRSPSPLSQGTHNSTRSRSATPLPAETINLDTTSLFASTLPPVVGRAPSDGQGSGYTSRSHSPADFRGTQPISQRHIRATIAAHYAAQPERRVRRGSHSSMNSRAVTPSIDPALTVSNPTAAVVNPMPANPNSTRVAGSTHPLPAHNPPTTEIALSPMETNTGGGCSSRKASRTVTLQDLPESQQVLVPAMRVSILFHLVAYEAWPVQLTPILEKGLDYAKSIPSENPVPAVILDDLFKKHLKGKPAAVRGEMVKHAALAVEREYQVSPAKRTRLDLLLTDDVFLYGSETIVPLTERGYCEHEALASVICAMLFGPSNLGTLFIEELCGHDGQLEWHVKLKDKTAKQGLPIGVIAFAAVLTRHALECIPDRGPSKRKNLKFEQIRYGAIWTRYRKQLIKYRFLGQLRTQLTEAVMQRYNEENPALEGSETDSSNPDDQGSGGDTDLESNTDEGQDEGGTTNY